MLNDTSEVLDRKARRWLSEFELALAASDRASLERLFRPDGHWRDLVALTWGVTTVSGAAEIADAIARRPAQGRFSGFEVASERTPPRRVTRAEIDVVEVIFRFMTPNGQGAGVVRLAPDDAAPTGAAAITLLTTLEALHDGTEARRHPTGRAFSKDFRGPNWLDDRKAAAAYADRDPAVLVVGGGQAGLSIAAQLTQLKIDTLIVDREARVGDNWRKRYHALSLHNQVHVNHLPFMPYPPTWPTYLPKDKIAGWFEAYAESMELNFWTGTEFLGGGYDADKGCWTVTLRHADGSTREMQPRHVVMATGVSGIRNLPTIPSLEAFAGAVLHSSDFSDSDAWAGREAIVIGSGTSGHDLCQDLHSHGASVTMVQRSSTTIVNVEPSAQLPYAHYAEGSPLADSDLIAASFPFQLLRKAHQLATAEATRLDRDLLDGLTRAGFKIDFEDETGWQFKYLERGGGYYFNVGCSDMIVSGEIGLVQFDDIETFTTEGARLRDGRTLSADLVVLATGYKGLEHQVQLLFGDEVAERVGRIWGFDPETQELRNMFARTDQPGLWFIAGSFAQCRIYSKYLALQLKACEAGLISVSPGDAGGEKT